MHGQQVSHSLLSSFPAKLTHEQLQRLINTLESSSVCLGNPDEKFVELIKAEKGKIMNTKGKSVVATLDSAGEVCIGGWHYLETVQASTCVTNISSMWTVWLIVTLSDPCITNS